MTNDDLWWLMMIYDEYWWLMMSNYDCCWIVLGLFSERFSIVFGSFRDRFWFVLGSFWDRVGIVLGSFSDRFRIVLGPFWRRFGIVLASFWHRLGIVLGYIPYIYFLYWAKKQKTKKSRLGSYEMLKTKAHRPHTQNYPNEPAIQSRGPSAKFHAVPLKGIIGHI